MRALPDNEQVWLLKYIRNMGNKSMQPN